VVSLQGRVVQRRRRLLRSPVSGQAQFSGSFGTAPNWERKRCQRLRRSLIGVHDAPQRRQRPSTTSHPAITNRPHSTRVPRPTLLFKDRPIVRLIMRLLLLHPPDPRIGYGSMHPSTSTTTSSISIRSISTRPIWY